METDSNNPGRDWIGIGIIAMMLVGAILVSYYLITKDIASCTKDPIKYAFRDSNISKDYASAELRIYQNDGDIVPIFVKKISSNS